MVAPTYKVYVDWDSDGGLSFADFESGVDGWSSATFGTVLPTVERSTVRAFHGSASLLVTWKGASELAVAPPRPTFVIGRSYTVVTKVWVPSTNGHHVTCGIVGIGGFGSVTTVTNQWTETSLTFTATATTHQLLIWSDGPTTDGEQTWLDMVRFYGPGEDISSLVPGVISSIDMGYGRDQARSLQPVTPGDVKFTIDNVSRDFAVENESSPLAGLLGPGRELVVEAIYEDRCHALFNGFVDDFTANASAGQWTADFTGIDSLTRFKDRPISTPVYPALRTGEVMHKILDTLGWTGLRDIDVGATTIRWWWAESDDTYQVMQDVLAAEGPGALMTIGSSGEFIFRDRHHRLLRTASNTSQATFQDAVITSFATLVDEDSPVGWWRLNETSGTSAADSAGSFTGTYNGSPTLGVTGLLADEAGTAVSFENTTVKSVTIPGTSLNPTSLTLEAVVQVTSWNGNNRVVQKGNSDNQWRMLVESGVFKWDVFGKATVTTMPLSVGVPHHLAGTYDSATGIVALYVDGNLIATATATSGSAPSTAGDLCIAQKPGSGSSGDGFNGVVDEVALYDHVLTPDRIRAHAGEALRVVVEHDPPFVVNSGWRDLINHVELSVQERDPEQELSAIWTHDEAFTVAVGQTVQFTITTDEPFYGLQPATQGLLESVVPEDPSIGQAAWRPDVILTGGPVSVSYSRTSGQSATVWITASSAAIVSSIELRAHKIANKGNAQRIVRDDAASVARMGVRSYAPSIPWLSIYDAEALADLILGQRAERLPTVTFSVVNGTAKQLEQILARDLSDRITVIDAESGFSADCYIESIAHSIEDEGLTHRTTFGCEKVRLPATNLFRFDVSGAGFNDGRFAPSGLDDPATMFIFDQAGHGFNDGLLAT